MVGRGVELGRRRERQRRRGGGGGTRAAAAGRGRRGRRADGDFWQEHRRRGRAGGGGAGAARVQAALAPGTPPGAVRHMVQWAPGFRRPAAPRRAPSRERVCATLVLPQPPAQARWSAGSGGLAGDAAQSDTDESEGEVGCSGLCLTERIVVVPRHARSDSGVDDLDERLLDIAPPDDPCDSACFPGRVRTLQLEVRRAALAWAGGAAARASVRAGRCSARPRPLLSLPSRSSRATGRSGRCLPRGSCGRSATQWVRCRPSGPNPLRSLAPLPSRPHFPPP